jgi:polysaccharide pyruvyl transferase WcaK-like protein
VVCGSDQVWNIALYAGFDPAFFLEFLRKSVPRRISYAASFGDTQEFRNHRQHIRDLLSRFDRLSVRDSKSQNILSELTGRAAEHVLDPSFLTDYGPITPQRIFSVPYILVYLYGTSDFGTGVVQTLQRRLGMPLVSVHASLGGARILRSAGPLQWLSLMHHADFVCTNSFHGTCFSLINGKEFVTLPIAKGQSRLEDLLQTAGLPDRLVTSQYEVERCIESHINWNAVLARLQEARLRSQAFLREALNGCGTEC